MVRQNSEFSIIRQYFNASTRTPRKDVALAIGDDCAITEIKANQRLAITTDTLVEGIHFFSDIDPADLAYKAVAVNLSDLAAMGAEPAWISLALTLPKVDHHWLATFSRRFFEILDHYNVDLIGGDTTKGPLSISITAHGLLPRDKALCRHGAEKGDWIYVTGSLGDSAAGLALLQQKRGQNSDTALSQAETYLIERHLRPVPRVLFGQSIAPYASAAIDISDGLLADLSHILQRSAVSASLKLDKLPLSPQLIAVFGAEKAEQFALAGGEDYELCFTVADKNCAKLERELTHIGVDYTCIGQIRSQNTNQMIRLKRGTEKVTPPDFQGFEHF
ncbi:thiamine-phosphate kinase [Testudinibacter sp. TR-2022]|uniref:thiamine-phosphate kinase n=1 Tax=Testudinibacter sp. TR-2022 TaxID=2585029 RepID=UPI0011180B1D|nr:thiamine-phosphate kinase [Testudinibacter sp. TR-2022]TNH04874.1 thiamine-phosphate kinase [Pasteurellaceae bacterium Phil31]TNH08662.1 thiamine-phosphate kinase [Testudinibacter sp. TR-2022]TNH10956.1 thiamine-phosphate kinase [Testudinibacter sp. TR-2022]TNH13806.1 thiamine-phosphate kinase [Testudinibacter sp. TR-2022]TNH18283.1 thiamine-phosphate kinase [Testudinibacter sp. TR-2022]